MNGPGDDKALDYSASTSTSIGSNDARFLDDSDYEGVQILLSMRSRVFNCKCGEYLDSIKTWSEHQRICSESTEKTSAHREKCQLCNKTFLTCVALNIHSTKKHNKRKIRTDSVMHCPCGQSFTAKWRQNCVHKLNSHGRHCKAFKERETQCSICKKGFINRKSLEYHGLKAHKLAVPVNS
ncbi:GDNF-inducible zinc finger protein 1-like isoform X2 [Panonychus citri]|nr:GDNF-inducible zinc finger protein 1-like isoform X2 [Panonychus citri]